MNGLSGLNLTRKNRRMRRVADPTSLFARLTMAMKVNPNLERALEFSSSGEDAMSQDLRVKISRGRLERPAEILDDFIEEWKGDYPEMERAGHLLEEAANGKTRERYLDLAFDIVLEETRKRMRRFASSIYLPTLIIYSVGILLPLMLVALLPTFSVIGGTIGLAPIAAIYCCILPAAVYLLSKQILAKRPQVLSPPQVSLRKVPGKELLLCVCISLLPLSAAIGLNLSPDVGGILSLWGAVGGLALYFWLSSAEAYERRKILARMEEELPEVLMGLGGRVSEGRPAEDVLASISKEVRGSAFEECLARATANVGVGGMGLREAFFGAVGSFSSIDSGTVRGVMEMLVSFVERSTRVAGEAICSIAQHLAKLNSLREEIKEMFGEMITSMKSVAVFFAPFVVAITARLQEVLFLKSFQSEIFSGKSFSPPAFSIILAIYAVVLAAILMAYAVELEVGDDGVVKRMVLAVSLPMAMLMFTAAWAVGGWMLTFLL